MMSTKNWTKIIGWTARIYGGIVLLIPLIALFRMVMGNHFLLNDWRTYVLYTGLIAGLASAYKWPLAGGITATLGILVSGFIHPFIIPPGILYILYWFLKRKKDNTEPDN